MTDQLQSESQPEPDITPEWLRRQLSAHMFWMMQTLYLISGTSPGALADWVKLRTKLLKQTAPPEDGSIDPAIYDQGLQELMPHIEGVGDVLAEDLQACQGALDRGEALPPPTFSGSGGAIDGLASMVLARGLEQLAQELERQQATRYWIAEAFHLMSNGRPGFMAASIERKMSSLKSEPPRGPDGMSPAAVDQAMIAQLPAILTMGRDMAEHLRLAQATRDQDS